MKPFRILCTTNIENIAGVRESLLKVTNNVEIIHAQGKSYEEVVDLATFYEVDCLFCNPNAQNYIIGPHVLVPLKYVCTASTGTNHIDVAAAEKLGVKIISIKDDPIIQEIPSTAEHAMALTLALMRYIPDAVKNVEYGIWDCEMFVGEQIKGKTVGIIGYGRLGKMYEKMIKGFNPDWVFVYDPPKGHNDLDVLLERSDIISLHVHPNSDTTHMINDDTIKRMAKAPYLINTSRGEIVDEEAVAEAVSTGFLRGYAADVLESEFTDRIEDSPIWKEFRWGCGNILLTPHIGGMTREARELAYNRAVKLLKDELEGNGN